MRTFLYCEASGYIEKDQWLPNSWVNVECPTPDDIQFLLDKFKIPESFLSDIADTDERPRIEYEANWLLTILRIPLLNKDSDIPFSTVPIGIITNNDITISVCYYQTELIPDFIRYTRRKEVTVRNKYDLILRLIHSSAVWFLKYLKQINAEVANAEKALEKSIRNEDLLQLMNLEKSMVYFNTSIRGNEVMLAKLQNIFQDPKYIDKELVEDVEIELRQAHLTVNIYSDILTGTMDTFASIISNNVNTIMKRMTSTSIILMVPTLIASFYGMNVPILGENMPHAFAAIVLLSLSISTVAFIIFRKIKWF
ncbi:MAG: magnesium transporter CorA family protein [Parabacteroides sp.]|jgi:magnesium transporter|nr:magnesium transporter CorA family protein [Parabacteroides sp.]